MYVCVFSGTLWCSLTSPWGNLELSGVPGGSRELPGGFVGLSGALSDSGYLWFLASITATANASFAASIKRQLMLVVAVLDMLFVTSRMYIDTVTL